MMMLLGGLNIVVYSFENCCKLLQQSIQQRHPKNLDLTTCLSLARQIFFEFLSRLLCLMPGWLPQLTIRSLLFLELGYGRSLDSHLHLNNLSSGEADWGKSQSRRRLGFLGW